MFVLLSWFGTFGGQIIDANQSLIWDIELPCSSRIDGSWGWPSCTPSLRSMFVSIEHKSSSTTYEV
jgi:hypothetical protein